MIFRIKRKQFGLGSFISGLLIGAIFLGASVFMFILFQPDTGTERADGTVVEVLTSRSADSTTFGSVAEFVVDEVTYQAQTKVNTSSRPGIGDRVEVAYDPSNPADAEVVLSDFWTRLFPLIFAGVGALIILGTGIGYSRSRRRTTAINTLKTMGHKVTGVLVDVNKSSHNSNGPDGYKVTVAATDVMGGARQYVSDELSGLHVLFSMFKKDHAPVPVDVYIDPTDPEKYYVDIDDLPNIDANAIAELLKYAQQNAPSRVELQPDKNEQP